MKIFILSMLLTVVIFGQQPPTPTSVNQAPITANFDVVATSIVQTIQVGQATTVQFRAKFDDGRTTSDFRNLPVVFTTQTQIGNVTAETTQCNLEQGTCTVRSLKPQVLFLTAFLNGVFGKRQVTLNFVNMRSNFPARIDVTTSTTQAQEGVSSSVIATSPVTVDFPITVTAEAIYTNDTYTQNVYFPKGIVYGQRIEINTDLASPLSFRERRNFRVRMYGPNGVIAEGRGNSVGLSEWKSIEASLDENGDLSFVLDGPYDPSVDYTVTLLRGDRFRVELSQSRSELFVYAQGNKTKIMFNRGSLGENVYMLPLGFYTVNVNAFDRSNSIQWDNSRVDALSINGQFFLR